MTREEKIAGAAEIIVAETVRRGSHILLPDAAVIASKLYRYWDDRLHLPNLQPGEIAQHFRERYHGHPHTETDESGSSEDRG